MPLQNWGPIPSEQTYTYDTGVLAPTPEEIVNFVIRDVIGLPETAIYSQFKLGCQVKYLPTSGVEFVNPASYNANGYPYLPFTYIPYTNGMTFDFTPDFQNLEFLPEGTFVFEHKFKIMGLLSSGVWQDIDVFYYQTEIVVSNVVEGGPTVTFTPTTINYTHTQNSDWNIIPMILMGGDLWKVVAKPNFNLTSITAGVTITEVVDVDGNYFEASGSGAAYLSISLGDFYDTNLVFLPADLAGTFQVLQDDVPVGTIAWTVTVLSISDFMTNPYSQINPAFTLDTKFFEFFTSNTDTYFQLDSTIKTYDFFSDTLNEYFIPQKIVLFNGKSKINIGRVIHRLMKNFTAVNETLLQYKYATLDIQCAEKSFADNSTVRSASLATVTFLAGISRDFTDFGFLDFNPKPNRVTKTGFAYLNFIIPTGNYELRTFKNGVLTTTVALPATTGKVMCKKVSFSAFAQGDVIDFVIDAVGETNVDAPSKKYFVFPPGLYSNTIVWENEFLLQSALECTGEASIKTELDFQSMKVFQDLVEKTEHLATSKEIKFYINTGWLLQSDVDTIESLMRSKKVWLIQGNQTIILRPLGKTIVNASTERELIEFSLEFTINRTYDEETYSL